jgi:hypothetical protein
VCAERVLWYNWASGEDGSLTIYIQHDSPGKQSSWLPAPNGPFDIVNRLYWPRPEVVDGTRTPQPVKKADGGAKQGY